MFRIIIGPAKLFGNAVARSTDDRRLTDVMMKGRRRVVALNVAPIFLFLQLIGPINVFGANNQQQRLLVSGDHISCSVLVPSGWRPYKAANGLQYLIPESQKDEFGTGIYIWATPREGKKATKLSDTDELLTTLDGEVTLVRYFRGGPFQSVIRLSDPTTPGAVAYIEESDFFVEIVLGSTDADFAEAKRVFKIVVGSYHRTPPNKSLNRSGGSASRIKRDPAKLLGSAPPG